MSTQRQTQQGPALLRTRRVGWKLESRERYEREIANLKDGRESLNAQNNRLHKQLNDVSTQVTNLKKHSLTRNDEEFEPGTSSAGVENLQEVIRYLHRENEVSKSGGWHKSLTLLDPLSLLFPSTSRLNVLSFSRPPKPSSLNSLTLTIRHNRFSTGIFITERQATKAIARLHTDPTGRDSRLNQQRARNPQPQ